MKVFFPLIAFLLLILIQGCGTQATYPGDNEYASSDFGDHSDTPEQLIAKAIAEDNKHIQAILYLEAASLYWENNLLAQTGAALQSVNPEFLEHKSLQQYLLLNLKLGLAEKNIDRLENTLPLLVSTPLFQTRIEDQVELIKFMADAYRMTGRHINAAIILAENTGLFPYEDHAEIHEAIWSELRKASMTKLTQTNYTGDNYDVQGWLKLALIIRQNQISLEKQYTALNDWNNAWPAHPAANLQPHELEILSQLPNSRPSRITLALPFTGPLAEVGTAIRDGFMASYYDATQSDTVQSIAALAENPLEVHFYDTHENDIERLYDTFYAENALIIGPLDKKSLNRLTTYDELNTKTLALNYLENPDNTLNNLFQFGLAPETETKQIVQRMIQKNLNKIVVIAPKNDWGFRIHDAFSSALSEAYGTLIESAFYDDQASLSGTVAELLATADSKTRARRIQSISGIKLDFLPRRRQDLDAIFMVAQAKIARQLNPLFAFHYAKNIPVFATSQIHSPSEGTKEQDLNRIEFVEMPWMLSSANNVKNNLYRLVPESSEKYNRFYALGADAFNLAPRLQLLKEISDSQIEGQTGILSMSEDGTITRHMQWARFKNGKAIAIQE